MQSLVTQIECFPSLRSCKMLHESLKSHRICSLYFCCPRYQAGYRWGGRHGDGEQVRRRFGAGRQTHTDGVHQRTKVCTASQPQLETRGERYFPVETDISQIFIWLDHMVSQSLVHLSLQTLEFCHQLLFDVIYSIMASQKVDGLIICSVFSMILV